MGWREDRDRVQRETLIRAGVPFCDCETCGIPTVATATKRCNNCYEVESRLDGYLRQGGSKARAAVLAALVANEDPGND